MLQPFLRIPTFCVVQLTVKPSCQTGKYFVICFGVAIGFRRFLHGEKIAVCAAHTDVVSLQCRRHWKDNISMTRVGVPPSFVNDNGVWFLPGLNHLIKVLMMMEWITPTPVHNLDIWIGALFAVIHKLLARV